MGHFPPFKNELGIFTHSLDSSQHHSLEKRLTEASKAGFQAVELFDEDWTAYLAAHNEDTTHPWEPTDSKLALARALGAFINGLGMSVICVQPIRQVEGYTDPTLREESFARVREQFPFMRAFDTDLTFICSHVASTSEGVVVSDFATVVKHLQDIGEMAASFTRVDGGPTIRIGYEGLSWGVRNTWASTWEVVRAVNLPNVGLILDTFHWLAVGYADSIDENGTGLAYPSLEEAGEVLEMSLSAFIATVPLGKVFLIQLSDAELVSPTYLSARSTAIMPPIQAWSRNFRLFRMEFDRGGYLPVGSILTRLLSAGYTGPLSLEVFNESLHFPDENIPSTHANRGWESFKKLGSYVQSRQTYHNP